MAFHRRKPERGMRNTRGGYSREITVTGGRQCAAVGGVKSGNVPETQPGPARVQLPAPLAGDGRDAPSWPVIIASRSSRARAMRERIVPTGQPQMAAASA